MALDAGPGRNVSTPVFGTPASQGEDTIGSPGYATDVPKAWGEGLPPLADLLIALISSGQIWPEGSESGQAALAVAFRDLAVCSLTAAKSCGSAGGKVLEGYAGPAADAFRDEVERLGAGESGLTGLGETAHAYALQHDGFARETQYAKLTINAGFWVTLWAAGVAAVAAFFSAGATTSFVGPYARELRQFMDQVFMRLESSAGVRVATRVAPVVRAPAVGGRSLLARAITSHALREVPEEVAEGLVIDGYAQDRQRELGTRKQWDGRRTLAGILGDAGGAVLASKVARPMSRFVDRLPGIRALNAAARSSAGILNALRRYPGRALQSALINGAVSVPAGLVANGVVYGKWELPSAAEVLGGMVAGAGRTNTVSPFSVDVAKALARPGAALQAAHTTAATADLSDTARAPLAPQSSPPPSPAAPPSPPAQRGEVVPTHADLVHALSGAPSAAAPHPAPSSPQPVDHTLTDQQLRDIFHDRIVREKLTGATRSANPTMIVVGGQPGAGKSTTIQHLHESLQEQGGAIRIIVDEFKDFHPAYARLMTWNDVATNNLIQPIAKQWQAMAFEHAVTHGYNVIVEATLGDPREAAQFIQQFTSQGYRVETEFVATSGAQSRLAVLTRYLGEKVQDGAGRFVPAGAHDSRFRGSEETVGLLESPAPPATVSAVRIRLRNGEVIYSNVRGQDGEWTGPTGAQQALRAERERLWTPSERLGYTIRLHDLRATLEEQLRDNPADAATYHHLAQEADAVEDLARPWLTRDPAHADPLAFERELGDALYHDPAARDSAERVVSRLRDVLTALHRELYPGTTAGRTEQVFFKHDPTSPGQVGRDTISLADLRSGGNLRMLMTSLYNAAFFSQDDLTLKETLYELRSRPDWAEIAARAGLDVERLRPILERPLANSREIFKIATLGDATPEAEAIVAEFKDSQAARWSRTVEELDAYQRTPQDFRDRQMPLHKLELAAQLPAEPAISTNVRNDLDDPTDPDPWSDLLTRETPVEGEPMPWVLGTARYGMHTEHPWFKAVSAQGGFPVIAGISGTAARLQSIFHWIQPQGVSERDFTRALLGWMLPTEDHSIYEIVRGVEVASPQLFEGYDDATQLYDLVSGEGSA